MRCRVFTALFLLQGRRRKAGGFEFFLSLTGYAFKAAEWSSQQSGFFWIYMWMYSNSWVYTHSDRFLDA